MLIKVQIERKTAPISPMFPSGGIELVANIPNKPTFRIDNFEIVHSTLDIVGMRSNYIANELVRHSFPEIYYLYSDTRPILDTLFHLCNRYIRDTDRLDDIKELLNQLESKLKVEVEIA